MDAPGLIEKAIAAGAVGFVAKPFHESEIAAVVSKALGTP